MSKKKHDPAPRNPLDQIHPGARELRRKAETQASEGRRLESRSSGEMREPLHELRVHQIELEMQNEELRRTQAELEAMREKYFDLYDLAPVGYLVLNEQNLVLEANLTAATLLGENKGSLVNKPITRFLFPEDQDVYFRHHKHLYETNAPQDCELRMIRKDGSVFWAQIEATAAQAADGKPTCRAVINDISDRKQAEEELHEAELRYRTLADSGRALIWTSGPDKKCDYFNLPWLMFTGKTFEQELGDGWTEGVHPDDLERCVEIYSVAFDRREPFSMEYRLRHRDGSFHWLQDDGSPRYDRKGLFLGYIGHCLDVTAHKQAEAALQSSEARHRLLVENAQEAIVVAQDGILKFVNPMALRLSGYSEAALLSLPFLELIHPDDRNMVAERHRTRLSGETDQPRYAFRLLTHGGDVRWVEISAVQIDWNGRPATLNFLTDITDRRKAEDTIQADLREKEVLLREIHHRVKNNMQVISSLLNLQAEAVADGSARLILKEGQLRIRAMALVHEKLYRSRDLSRIDFAEYLQSLTNHLFHFFAVGSGRVRFKAEMEPIDLDINTAVPCGLIFHELASNALKHAFPNGREGIIEVGLGRKKDGTIRLRVADNGVGFPADLDFTLTKSFGLQIANLLAGQIDGTIALDRSKGTSFTLSFREMEKKRDLEPGRGLP
ncbi:MAG: PAS domain S-box protein [Candidatus Aminicenantes bacterium]|nr:PAS domain S-box protein [Candidatus Aminicenantes bacterium]